MDGKLLKGNTKGEGGFWLKLHGRILADQSSWGWWGVRSLVGYGGWGILAKLTYQELKLGNAKNMRVQRLRPS